MVKCCSYIFVKIQKEPTSEALHCPCRSKINARSIEWLKKTEDSSPLVPDIIQLVNSRLELTKLLGLRRLFEARFPTALEELRMSNNRINA